MSQTPLQDELDVIETNYYLLITKNLKEPNTILNSGWVTLHNLSNNITEFQNNRHHMLIILNSFHSSMVSLFDEIGSWCDEEFWFNDIYNNWMDGTHEELLNLCSNGSASFTDIDRVLLDTVRIYDNLLTGYLQNKLLTNKWGF